MGRDRFTSGRYREVAPRSMCQSNWSMLASRRVLMKQLHVRVCHSQRAVCSGSNQRPIPFQRDSRDHARHRDCSASRARNRRLQAATLGCWNRLWNSCAAQCEVLRQRLNMANPRSLSDRCPTALGRITRSVGRECVRCGDIDGLEEGELSALIR